MEMQIIIINQNWLPFIVQYCIFAITVLPSYGLWPQIVAYERIASIELRRKKAKEIYDKFIFADMLAMSTVSLSLVVQ